MSNRESDAQHGQGVPTSDLVQLPRDVLHAPIVLAVAVGTLRDEMVKLSVGVLRIKVPGEKLKGPTVRGSFSIRDGVLSCSLRLETPEAAAKERTRRSPRARALAPSRDQFYRLLSTLPPARRDFVLLLGYLGLRPREIERLRLEDVKAGSEGLEVAVRSGKTRPLFTLPLVGQAALVLQAAEAASRTSGPIVEPWPGIARDLPGLVRAARLPALSVNALRGAAVDWMSEEGVSDGLIARFRACVEVDPPRRFQ